MTTPKASGDTFVRLSRPAMPVVRLTAEPDADAPPASIGEWVRLSRPALPVVTLIAEPFKQIATVVLRRPLAAGDDAAAIKEWTLALAAKVNEMEVIEGRPGFRIDEGRSGIRVGDVVVVLAPNDPTNALATCKRVANILFNASPGVTVKVFAADAPETPVLELVA